MADKPFWGQKAPRNLGEFAQWANGMMPQVPPVARSGRAAVPVAHPSSINQPSGVSPQTHGPAVISPLAPQASQSPASPASQPGAPTVPPAGLRPLTVDQLPGSLKEGIRQGYRQQRIGGLESGLGRLQEINRNIAQRNATGGVPRYSPAGDTIPGMYHNALASGTPLQTNEQAAAMHSGTGYQPRTTVGGRFGAPAGISPFAESQIPRDVAISRLGNQREAGLYDISHRGGAPGVGLSLAPTTQQGYNEQMQNQNPGARNFGGALPTMITSANGTVRPGFMAPPSQPGPVMSEDAKNKYADTRAGRGVYYDPRTGVMGGTNNVVGQSYAQHQKNALAPTRQPGDVAPSQEQLASNRENYLAARQQPKRNLAYEKRQDLKQRQFENAIASSDPGAYQNRQAVANQQAGILTRTRASNDSAERIAGIRAQGGVESALAKSGESPLAPKAAEAPKIGSLAGTPLTADDHNSLQRIALETGSASKIIDALHHLNIKDERTVNRVVVELLGGKRKPNPSVPSAKDYILPPGETQSPEEKRQEARDYLTNEQNKWRRF